MEFLLLTVVRICTYKQQQLLTNASGFFFERAERLFLVTSRHVMIDQPSEHFPDCIEIEVHTDPNNMAKSVGFSIPLYAFGARVSIWLERSTWRRSKSNALLCPR